MVELGGRFIVFSHVAVYHRQVLLACATSDRNSQVHITPSVTDSYHYVSNILLTVNQKSRVHR
jgi:hypothetical protein